MTVNFVVYNFYINIRKGANDTDGKNNCCQLIEATQSNLEIFNFSKWTIDSYDFHWKQLTKFAETKQVKFYTPEFGARIFD